jgi:hypothetical protein
MFGTSVKIFAAFAFFTKAFFCVVAY